MNREHLRAFFPATCHPVFSRRQFLVGGGALLAGGGLGNAVLFSIARGMKEAGCHEMTIFLRGNSLFLYALIDDIAEFNRIRAKDPAYHRWNDWMNQLLEAPFDEKEDGAFASMEEIWRFEEGDVP